MELLLKILQRSCIFSFICDSLRHLSSVPPHHPRAVNTGKELHTNSLAPVELPFFKGLFNIYLGKDRVLSGERGKFTQTCQSFLAKPRVCPFSDRSPVSVTAPLWRPGASRAHQNLRGQTTEAWFKQQTHFWKVLASSLGARLREPRGHDTMSVNRGHSREPAQQLMPLISAPQ